MKLGSKYFDDIRVKPNQDRSRAENKPICEWEGCNEPAEHRAPAGRNSKNKFRMFCTKHVKEYNANYNYFEGMADDDIRSFQKDASLGHRPTWAMGVDKSFGFNADMAPPHMAENFKEARWRKEQAKRAAMRAGPSSKSPKAKPLTPAAKNAFEKMGLEFSATGDEIKSKYKDSVKRLHPDANGGDRKYEERLREIITAYTYLKRSGYCS